MKQIRLLFIGICIAVCFAGCNENIDYSSVSIEKTTIVPDYTSAKITIKLSSSPYYPIREYGVYLSESNSNPNSNDNIFISTVSNYYESTKTITVTSLNSNTTYYVRAFIRNEYGSELVGEIVKFTTKNYNGGGSSALGSKISDFIGTYSIKAYNWDKEKYETWSDVKIDTFFYSKTNSFWIAVSGLNGWPDHEYAYGEFDSKNKAIRLYYGLYSPNDTYYLTSRGDNTLFYSIFTPTYADKGGNNIHYITNGSGYNGYGEVWLRFNNNKLVAGPAADYDSEGYKANGYTFECVYAETDALFSRFSIYIEVELTKTSSATSAPKHYAPQHSVVNMGKCEVPIDKKCLGDPILHPYRDGGNAKY